MLEITNENFKDTLANANPVLIDFWATWCGPCRMMAPIFEELADEHKDTAVLAKLDIDQCPEIAKEYGVMSVPTFIAFKGGQEIAREVGARPRQALENMLQVTA